MGVDLAGIAGDPVVVVKLLQVMGPVDAVSCAVMVVVSSISPRTMGVILGNGSDMFWRNDTYVTGSADCVAVDERTAVGAKADLREVAIPVGDSVVADS